MSVESRPDRLFDERIFLKLNPNRFVNKYDKFIICNNASKNEYYVDLGDNFILRSLRRDDYSKDYLKLLSQLTVVGDISKEQFEKRYDCMKSCYNAYFILVVEDLTKKCICASVTHVYEQKFLRNTSARGRIEDVVVDEKYRGKNLSKVLLDVAIQISQMLGCYKLSLECDDKLVGFYRKLGFDKEDKQNYLCQRFVASKL